MLKLTGLFAAFLLLLGGCFSSPQLMRVGTNVWPGYELLYLARSLGKLDGRQIRLVEYPSTSGVLAGLRNGLLEAGALTLDEALQAQAEGLDLSIVLVTDISHGADVLLARPEIERLADIRGQRVGYEETALGAYMLGLTLQAARLELTDIVSVPVPVDEHLRAYRNGQVDAVVTFEPVRSQLLEQGARELFSSADVPGKIVDVLVVRRDVAEQRPQQVQALVDAWYGALKWMSAHRQQALQRMAPREHLTPQQLEAALEGLKIPGRHETVALFRQGSLQSAAEQMQRSMQASGLLASAGTPLDKLFDSRFVTRGIE